MRTPTLIAAISAGTGVLALAVATAAVLTPAVAPRTPNVLVVVWDTVRADRLSVYGHDKPTTPFLEEIAPRSVVWDQAVSPSYWTLPAHASLFTGLSVTGHGATADYKWLDDHYVTLAEHFGAQGYDTYAWSSNPNINRTSNMVQGFDTFHQAFGQNRWREQVEAFTLSLIHPKDESTPDRPDKHTVVAYHKSGTVIHDAFTGWLDSGRDPDRPFFGFLNYMEAHAYRLPTEEARRAVMPDRTAYRNALLTSNVLRRQTNVMFGRWRRYWRHERQALYDLYDASLYDLDAYLRGVFVALEERGLLDDTIVVLTSDHGEQFGEHGLYLHNFSVYQPLVHVPLVVHYPAGLEPDRIEAPVSTAGLFHTLAQIAGIPAPDQPILATDLRTPTGAVVAELKAPCGNPERRRLDTEVRDWTATYEAVYLDDLKLIWASNGRHELYDLASDPWEKHNQFDARSDDVATLQTALQSWREAQPTFERTEAQQEAEAAKRAAEADDDLAEQLEALGYAEGN